MEMDNQRRSSNIEDQRGRSGGGFSFPGSNGGRVNVGRGGASGIGILIILGLAYLLGGPSACSQLGGMLMGAQPSAPGIEQPASAPGGEAADPQDTGRIFMEQVLGSTEDVWTKVFNDGGMTHYKIPAGSDYPEPPLVLFSGSVQSACGMASSASGPFYCPGDNKLYLDMTFFNELKTRFGAPGDFAQAYVIAHEAGHHIQNVIGLLGQVQKAQARMGERERNQLQVRVELQADCFGGVWGHFADKWKGQLSAGDVEEALRAASAIGDDTLQKQSQGYVVPDAFTHGSSQQRQHWFNVGYRTGDPAKCDTLAIQTP